MPIVTAKKLMQGRTDRRRSSPEQQRQPERPARNAASSSATQLKQPSTPTDATSPTGSTNNSKATRTRRTPSFHPSLRQPRAHIEVQRLLSHQLLQPLVLRSRLFSRFASSAFIPPYCARERDPAARSAATMAARAACGCAFLTRARGCHHSPSNPLLQTSTNSFTADTRLQPACAPRCGSRAPATCRTTIYQRLRQLQSL
jgi:hypothetical protein